MSGFDRLLPARKLVDEIITSGVAQKTGVTGWSGQGAVARLNTWTGPFLPPSSSAYVMAAQMASTSASITITTFTSSAAGLLNSPDFPRAVRVCPSTSALNAANSSVAVVVNGTNQYGATATDTISMGNGPGPVDGIIAFKTITSVVLPACSSPSTPFTIGLSNIFGLDRTPGTVSAVIRGSVNGVVESTAPVVGVASSSGTVSPASAVGVPSRGTVKFSTAATSSAGSALDVLYVPQDTTHI
jgi:hypothetical protein